MPLIWPIGGGTPDENVSQVKAKMDEGYRSFHIKIGAFHPDKDVARIAAIRELEAAAMRSAFMEAVSTCAERSEELA